MLKYHVAVCDDEKSDLDGIVQSVQQYDVQGCFDIETYMDGNELLSELQMQKKSFDLLLLDIEMPSNGFQLAQSLIQMEKHPLVVFVTKRHEYAVQGYLADLNEQAQERLDTIMEQMKATEGVTEELKRTQQMEWVQRCNNIHNRAEEIVLHDIIYSYGSN